MTPAEYLKRPYARVVVPEADESYRAEILEFPGCLAVGDSAMEALARLEDVAASWLESVIARGQPVPAPIEENEYSGKTVLRLAKSIHQRAAAAARHDGISLNSFIANCVAEQLGVRKKATHLVAHFSQQNNMVFIEDKTSAAGGRPVIATTTGWRSSTAAQNPWKRHNG